MLDLAKNILNTSKNQNIFEFTLPLSKKVIEFKILSHKDEAKVAETAKRMKKKAKIQKCTL